MAKYQKYAEYKDSGIEWLGEIPSHWTATALKRYSRITDGSHHSPKIEIEGFPFVSVTDVGINNINFFDAKKITETDYLRLVKEGCKPAVNDVLLTKDGTIGRACIVTEDMPDFVILSSLGLITPNKEISSHFLYYYLVSGINVDQMNSVIHGSALKRMTINKINDLILTFPDFYEQEKIASFLDHETAKIDSLIAKQEKLIELLKEKRQAVISHAVTKGLNPDVAMKDSGVEWLGQVPEHWIVKSYRHASKIYRGKFGHRPRNDPAFYDGEYPFIQTGDVARAGKYITSYSQTLNEKGKEVSQLFPKGTLMMAIAANIGDLAILGFEAYAPDSVVGFKPNQDIDLEFLRYSFKAALPALEQTSTQSTQANLNVERIGAVQGVFPSLNDQQEIVGYLDDMLNKYSVIEKEMHKAIELLQERRTALISSAVTGKIDVRNWQDPNEAKTELSL